MGSSKKNRPKNPTDDGGVDLLSLAFNLPTRRDFERADREAAQQQASTIPTTQSIRIQYDPGEYESSDTETSNSLDANNALGIRDASETPKAQKIPKPRRRQQAPEPKAVLQTRPSKDGKGKADQQPLPTRRTPKRESSKPPKARGRSSSSPAAIRASSSASSIPSSATFPRATFAFGPTAANIASSDASVRPHRPAIGRGAPPQQYYQPLFAFPTVPVYPPTQYYSTVATNNSVSDCNQFVPLSMYSQQPPPTKNVPKSAQQSGLVSQQVSHIQSKLDEVVMKLSKHPQDVMLKNELSALQTELNTRLNSLLGMEPPKESKVSDAAESRHSKTKHTEAPWQHATTQREVSPERKIRHHLCMGCGKVRSSNYHNKHPIVAGSKPSMNYCEDCFEEKVESGLFKHHFCHGCGTARSKEFQQDHPILKGDRPFPNYCSICVEEMRSTGAMADVSMIDFAPSRSYASIAYSNATHDQVWGSKLGTSLKSRQVQDSEHGQSNVFLSSVHADKSNKLDQRDQKRIPQALKLSASGPQLSPSNSSPDSPYYPVRSTGASQRRVERSPLASPGSQYCSSPDTPLTPRYRSPYVEDIVSPIQEANQRLGSSQQSSRSSSSHGRKGGTSHSVATDEQESQDERHDHVTKIPSSDSSQEMSDDSIEGHASTDDSAHSGGSKSVKFRPKVDIRFSDSRTSSNASSNVKILEEDIKPDDDTIPSRVGIYGTSPVKSQNGYYTRAKEPHNNATSTLAGEGGHDEVIPERSYRGAFSKDSPASSWQAPASNMGGPWYSRPTTGSFTGFQPGRYSTFNYGSGGATSSQDGLPPLRATAAFTSSGEAQGSQRPSHTPASDTQHEASPESPSHRWQRKGSHWSNFPSRFDSECHTMQDDSSFSQSAFSDYSQPSSNPYYEPRKRPFSDLNDYCYFGTTRAPRIPGKWARDYQSTARTPKRKTPYWIPEPIIEEPDSPPSSPGQQTNMLEFDDIEISLASASNVSKNASPDSKDGSSGSSPGAEDAAPSGGDSDKENTPSKSSL